MVIFVPGVLVPHNHLGQRVYQRRIQEVQNPRERLDLMGMSPGTYLVKLSTLGESVTRKLMLSR